MFHKDAASSSTSLLPTSSPPSSNQNSAGLSLVWPPVAAAARPHPAEPPRLLDLAIIAARRCSSFFAEAAVLVLVFGLLDTFILKGHIDLRWIAGALLISVALLLASIATDFGAHRWIKAHP